MMDFRQEIELHYTDPERMITQVRDPQFKWTSGNHLLITGTYFVILKYLGLIRESDSAAIVGAASPCEIEPGLYNRNSGRFDKESHDDYIGVVAGSAAAGAPLHREILEYGQAHWWKFDNDKNFDFGDFFIRMPGFVAFVKAANGKPLGLISQLSLSVSLLWNSFTEKEATSGVILRWLQIQTVAGKHSLIDFVIRFWKRKTLSKYPGGMGDVFGIYYGEWHPFAVVMAGKI